MWQQDAYRMIQRRAKTAGIEIRIGNHTFRATGITAQVKNSGTREPEVHHQPPGAKHDQALRPSPELPQPTGIWMTVFWPPKLKKSSACLIVDSCTVKSTSAAEQRLLQVRGEFCSSEFEKVSTRRGREGLGEIERLGLVLTTLRSYLYVETSSPQDRATEGKCKGAERLGRS